ncbi:MAG: hypothetical protein MK116_05195 [Phycisphaerales bacterium]|nr:hypothetical protein [Phycisphaerales bacterium]
MFTSTNAIQSVIGAVVLGASLSLAGEHFQEPPCDVPQGDDSCWPNEFGATEFTQWTVAEGGNDHWYCVHVFDGPVPWWKANRKAQSMGGYLATVESIGENNHIYYLSLQAEHAWSDCFGPWIGLFRCPPAGGNPQAGWTWCNEHMNSIDFTTDDYENFPPGALGGSTVLSYRTCLDGSDGPSSFWRAVMPTPQGGSLVRSAIFEMDMGTMADCNGNGIPDSNDVLNGAADINGNLVPDECDCLSDIDGDQQVSVDDVLEVLSAWNTSGVPGLNGDVTWDGQVDVNDILAVIDAYGPCDSD